MFGLLEQSNISGITISPSPTNAGQTIVTQPHVSSGALGQTPDS
jgi:hypothetical protein